jgi:hypothetical protein
MADGLDEMGRNTHNALSGIGGRGLGTLASRSAAMLCAALALAFRRTICQGREPFQKGSGWNAATVD